jgi:hypothetical protein
MDTRYKLVCNIQFGDMAVQLLIWALLSIVTFGIAAFFFPYYLIKLILNNTEIRETQALSP